jgi:hypothetical protein
MLLKVPVTTQCRLSPIPLMEVVVATPNIGHRIRADKKSTCYSLRIWKSSSQQSNITLESS